MAVSSKPPKSPPTDAATRPVAPAQLVETAAATPEGSPRRGAYFSLLAVLGAFLFFTLMLVTELIAWLLWRR